MTREEAIQIISEYDVKFGYHTEFEITDALDMAMQALEQELTSPCDLCRFDYMDGVCGDCPAMAKGEWE